METSYSVTDNPADQTTADHDVRFSEGVACHLDGLGLQPSANLPAREALLLCVYARVAPSTVNDRG
jgi:hypothetical protein